MLWKESPAICKGLTVREIRQSGWPNWAFLDGRGEASARSVRTDACISNRDEGFGNKEEITSREIFHPQRKCGLRSRGRRTRMIGAGEQRL